MSTTSSLEQPLPLTCFPCLSLKQEKSHKVTNPLSLSLSLSLYLSAERRFVIASSLGYHLCPSFSQVLNRVIS